MKRTSRKPVPVKRRQQCIITITDIPTRKDPNKISVTLDFKPALDPNKVTTPSVHAALNMMQSLKDGI
jgi:hypothetical protein